MNVDHNLVCSFHILRAVRKMKWYSYYCKWSKTITYRKCAYHAKCRRCCPLIQWLLCRLRSWRNMRRFRRSGLTAVAGVLQSHCPKVLRFGQSLLSVFWLIGGWKPLLRCLYHGLHKLKVTLESQNTFCLSYVVDFAGRIHACCGQFGSSAVKSQI